MKKFYSWTLLFLLAATLQAQYISEVMYNSPSTDYEWIEIANESGSDVDVSSWDLNYNGNTFTFPSSSIIPDGAAVVVLVGDGSAGTATLGFTPDYFAVALNSGDTNNLVNSSATITLNDGSTDISTVIYDDGDGADGNGDSQKFDSAGNFVESSAPTPQALIANTDTSVQFAAVTANLAEDGLFITIDVEITNEDATNDTTVEIALDGSSTATNGTDYDDGAGTPAAIAFPITLTFPAGTNTNQSFDIYISNDDMDVEGNETVVLNLQNATGGNNAMIGANNQFTLTITDNDSAGTTADARINEFHYDNDGGDVGEFVEIFIADPQPADLNLYTITLYNGGTGSSYDSETLDNAAATAGNNRAGTPGTFYVWNTSLQNGSPDGIALDYNGTLIQFISYEGVFTPTAGPANGQSSEDVGVSQPGSTPIGSSIAYNDDNMMWEESNDDTPGTTNGNFLSTINNQTKNKTIQVYVDAGYLKTTNTEVKSLEVYSVNGQRVAAANTAQVNVSNLQSGVYIVRIVDNNGQTTTQKFIKK